MNELNKTFAFVGVALALTGTAVLATWPRDRAVEAFSDQGQPFFPSFKDPREATALEVVDFDEPTAEARAFKVMLKDGKWVIPSHNDYPADAKDRLAKTAAGVIDLKKDVIVSDSPDTYESLGVIDPLDKKATSLKGRGKRVTLKNKSGEVLADFVIGKEVPNRPGQRYVRVPDVAQKRTYAVNVNVDLSTRFADWIETNLLKLDASRLRKVTFDNHKVDPERGTVERGDLLTIERPDSAGQWTLAGGLPADQEVNPDKVSGLSTALGDLKIVGVRPKPPGLTQELKASTEKGISLTRDMARSLAGRGFYLVQDGLLSNQGDVIVTTDEGIVYVLRFGEVTFASGEALSAGAEDSAASKADAKGKDKDKKDEGSVESRYLFVTARFDRALIPEPKAEAKPKDKDPSGFPDDAFQRTPQERADKEKADKEKADREKADFERKVADGQKRAKELTDRFAAWYYVVPGDAFRSVVLDRAALVRKKSDTKPPAGPGAFPSFPGAPGGFPPPSGPGGFSSPPTP
jgi:hypothetical protein